MPLAEGLRNRVVVPQQDPTTYAPMQLWASEKRSNARCTRSELNDVETRWSVAWTDSWRSPLGGRQSFHRPTLCNDKRGLPQAVFAAVCRIGGGNGWYPVIFCGGFAVDGHVLSGPRLRRGRRDSERVEFGEALDFWRVVGIDRDRSLSLLAEMKLPGTAKLNFDLDSTATNDRTQLTMTAKYRPKGC